MSSESGVSITFSVKPDDGSSVIRLLWMTAPPVEECICGLISPESLVDVTRKVCASLERIQLSLADQIQWESYWGRLPPTGELPALPVNITSGLAMAGLYGGIYEYLSRSDRLSTYRADHWMLFVAWQYYSILKWAYIQYPDESPQKQSVASEMAHAYRNLSRLIENAGNASALRWLAEVMSQQKPAASFRENLLLGMVLRKRDSTPPTSLQSPVDAPGVAGKIVWDKVELHPVFVEDEGGLTALRNLITGKIINRYDYSTALYLARLIKLQKDRPGATRPQALIFTPNFWLWGGLLSVAWVALWSVLITLFARSDAGRDIIASPGEIWLALLICLGPLLYLIGFISTLHHAILPYLFLPRLVGGISLAYGALVFEGELKFVEPLWSRGCFLICLIWGGVLGLVFLYLYQDILPLVRNKSIASHRALLVLLVSLMISFTVGFLASAVLTAPGLSIQNVGALLLFGPFGWVDYHQLLVIIPIGLLTGLVTQFMFEEKTVTAPVWALEED